MFAKFVIFVAVSAFLVTSLYSSVFIAFVGAETKCTIHPKNGDTTCVSGDGKKVQYCWHDPKTGRVAGCITIAAKNIPADVLEEALGSATIQNKPDEIFKKALDAAIQESPNATKVPNTDVLQDGDFPLPPLGSDDSVKEPKVPNDLGGLKDQEKTPTINPDLP